MDPGLRRDDVLEGAKLAPLAAAFLIVIYKHCDILPTG
jgi:hypothetical protein